MIRASSLFCDCAEPGLGAGGAPKVTWELADANADAPPGTDRLSPAETDRLSPDERLAVVDQLADFGVEVVRFEGVEDVEWPAFEDLLGRVAARGLETTLRVEGRHLSAKRLESLAAAGLDRISVLVPGLSTPREAHIDADAIDAALGTLETGTETPLKTELRFPLEAGSRYDMEEVYDLAALLSVDRFRLSHVISEPPMGDESRQQAVRRLLDITRDAHERGTHLETVLSGGIDAGYVATYASERLDAGEAATIRETLRDRLGAAPSPPVAKLGPAGAVYPGPAWDQYFLGSVRDRPFGSIWTDETNPLLERLRHEEARVPERCRHCSFNDVCAGGSRGRALQAHGDPFAPDPVCYVDRERTVQESPSESTAD